jgi:hypothetical protein
MNKYRVTIHGQNYLIKLDELVERMGFYTTRHIGAENKELAVFKAVEHIQNDDKLTQIVLNAPDNPPLLYAEEVLELESFEGVNPPGTGYSFYRYADKAN